MFPLWFTLLGGSFVFLDVGPSILFLVFPPFLDVLVMLGRVSSLYVFLLTYGIHGFHER